MCPNEFTWAMYADGELPEDEVRQVREHWAGCPACRALAAALDQENRALVLALQEIDLVDSARQPAVLSAARRFVVELATLVFGVALVGRITLDIVSGIALPPALDWINPLGLPGQLNLLLTSIVYLMDEGGLMVTSIVNNLVFVAIAVLILFAAPKLLRRSVSAGVLCGTILLLFVFSTPSYAIEMRSGGKGSQAVVVAAGETINDTLLAGGDSVIIEGTIAGDLIATARRVIIRGKVQGDVISAAQTIEVEGIVEGNIYGAAEYIQMRGKSVRNLYGFAETITIDRQSEIRENAIGFANSITIDGIIGRDAVAFADTVDLHGNIASDVAAHAGQVTVMAPARIAGNLVAEVPETENLKVDSGAFVGGKTDLRTKSIRPSQYATAWFYIKQIIWLAAAFITGLILFWLFPALSRPNLDNRQAMLTAGGIGFVAAVATPVAAIVIGITLIGLPIALVSIALWVLGLYLAKIVVAVFVGRALFPRETTSPAAALITGLALVLIAINVPYVGGLINILLMLMGFGAILVAFYRGWRRQGRHWSGVAGEHA